MQPPADVRANGLAERAVELGALDWLTPVTEDRPSCNPRVPLTVSVALRRAAKRVRAEKEFTPACDVAAADAGHALGAICEAVRQAYVRGRCGPVSSGPVALQVLQRLRQTFVEEIDGLRTSLKPGELCGALRAFDLVREEMDRDETARFAAVLRSSDALELLVEIAHDMRSPLTAILMLTEIVRRAQAGTPDDGAARQLALVYSAAFGLNALINDVITVARGGDRLIDSECVPFSTSALMHSVADILRPVAEERKLALQVTTPAADGRVGQPIALSRVLLNLASNALNVTETGEVAIRAVDLCSARVCFEVADTGPGIPPDMIPALFEPFGKRSSGTRSHRFSRTGLGLGICRKLLHDMGSELRVESASDQGTRFFFELTLPVADGCDVPGAASGALIL
ncbi:MAG: HAMP domain-containing histidine kinase [Gemmatimonadota bacterium]|nr:HAMP domain-containing histidine kinase [Gemmatimonadota bacterium]